MLILRALEAVSNPISTTNQYRDTHTHTHTHTHTQTQTLKGAFLYYFIKPNQKLEKDQPVFTCLKATMGTSEQFVDSVPS